LTYSLQTFSDSIAPQKVPAYLAQADRIWNSTGLQLPRTSAAVIRRADASTGSSLVVFLILITAFITVGVVVVIKIRRERRTPFRQTARPGTSPETAMRCKDKGDLEGFTKQFKCRCGSNTFDPDALAHQETLFYDGERLGTIKMKCKGCGHASDLYFVQPLAPA
jgi:hypothetical protein